MSANIGAVNSNPAQIGYRADNVTGYQNRYPASLAIQGTEIGTITNWNHSVPVTEFSSEERNVNILPPYLAVYMWERSS